MNKNHISVCFFSPDAYPYFNPIDKSKLGGAELQIYIFATELAKDQSYDVHVIVDHDIPNKSEVRENVTIHQFRISSGGLKYAKTLWRLIPAYNLFKKIDADVYIQRGASFWTAFARILSSMLNKKFIYMVAHDGDADRSHHPRRKGVVRRIMWWLYEYGMVRADLVIAQNEWQQNRLKQNYGKDSVLRLSAHRIPETPPSEDRETVLWVGRAKEWKHPELFVELARDFPNQSFDMVMPSFGEENMNIKNIKEQIHATPNIKFHDYVPPNEIDALFQQAKVYVLTSTDEGFPNTFIQAAKAGTPILSYCIDPNGMIESHKIGINAHRDKVSLHGGLEELLTNKTLWETLSGNAKTYAHDYHNIEKIIENDKKLLRYLVENPGG